jgi:DNA polymerase
LSDELDPAAELLALTSALRGHVEWQKATGVVELPRAAISIAPVDTPLAETRQRPRPAPARTPAPAPAPIALPPPRPLAERLDATERATRLQVLADEVAPCTKCRLHETRTQTVFARGTGSAGLCFVGEGPGADEDAQGFPFVGKAGQLLDRMIEAMGLGRDEVYVANVVKCRPPNNRKPELDEMAACVGYLERQLEIIQPEVIVALGATAVQGLLGTTEGITRMRGNWKLYKGRIAVMPTFHPAYLLRTPTAKRDVWNDLQAVLRQMGRAIPPPRK